MDQVDGPRESRLVLTSPGEVRADVIRQLHERPAGREIADLLIFLEEWEWAPPGHDRETVSRLTNADGLLLVGRGSDTSGPSPTN
jgi:hypothetical protein